MRKYSESDKSSALTWLSLDDLLNLLLSQSDLRKSRGNLQICFLVLRKSGMYDEQPIRVSQIA